MATATIRATKDKEINVINTGNIKRTHRSMGTLHILNIAMSPPKVGFIKLETPSPI